MHIDGSPTKSRTRRLILFHRLSLFAICAFGTLEILATAKASGQGGLSNASSEQSKISDDRANQRWIPVDRRKLGELGRLGELLQNPQPMSTNDDASVLPSGDTTTNQRSLPIDLSKVDLKKLEERLAKLSPEQKEQLKKLATRFAQNESIRDLASAYKELPPALVDQVRESPSLREFAQDVLEDRQEELPSKNSDAIDLNEGANQPWIKFDPANSAVRREPRSSEEKDGPRSNLKSMAEDSDSKAKNDSSEPGTSSQRDRAIESPTGSPSNRSGTNAAERTGVNNSDKRASQQQIANDGNANRGIRSNSASKTSSSSRSPRASGTSSSNQPSNARSAEPVRKTETAYEALRRRVGELGLGQTFEKLAKEAVGIEKTREAGAVKDQKGDLLNAEKNASKRPGLNNAQNATTRGKASSQFSPTPSDALSEKSTPRSQSSNELPRPTMQQPATSAPRPTPVDKQPTPSGSTTNQSEDMLSSWRAPTWDDLPSFSVWHLFLLVLLLGLTGALFFVNRAPQLVRRAAQRRREEVQKNQLLEMEIMNREQVVMAFDMSVARQLRSFEDWWTSQRVVRYASDRGVPYSTKLQAAEQVYKNARYAPPEETLSEHELVTVREAIRECLKSRDDE